VSTDRPADHQASTGPVIDDRNRPLRDLRISVTDRCNFRCVYCMPKQIFGKDFVFMEREELLTFEEIARLARIAVDHGVEKIRLTGGEPLLRKSLPELVGMLAALRTPDGREIDIALTTNGSALAVKAQALKDAGLKRVTVSLDSLNDATFKAMNDADFPVATVCTASRRRMRSAWARSRSTWWSSVVRMTRTLCRWHATSRVRPPSCVSSSSWMSGPRTAGSSAK
jgi:GTP 3',8-cyclase